MLFFTFLIGIFPNNVLAQNNAKILPPSEICKLDKTKALAKNQIQVGEDCCACLTGNNQCNGLTTGNTWTQIGCIPSSTSDLTIVLIRIFFGVGLFIMLIKIILAGYSLQTSNDPDTLKNAKEEIIAIISGFVVAALGIVILEFMGISVLGLGPILNELKVLLPSY